MSQDHFRKLERMYQHAPINDFFKPTMTISKARAEVKLEVRRDFFHAADAVHGSVYFKMLDDAAWFAVNSLVEDVFVLTVDFTVNLLRPFDQGTVISIGRATRQDESSYLGESRLVDENGRELGLGRGVFVKGRKPLSPEIGYE